jgi:sulfide:quinone oxidoreductase
MEVKKISPFISVSPQIYPAQMARLAEMGFKTLINNRPERETDDQPLLQDLKAEAEKYGMQLISIPIIPGAITEQNVSDFSMEIGRVQGPVLVYCRSGMRSTSLWARYEARHVDPDTLIGFAKSIGYDLGPQKKPWRSSRKKQRASQGRLSMEHRWIPMTSSSLAAAVPVSRLHPA